MDNIFYIDLSNNFHRIYSPFAKSDYSRPKNINYKILLENKDNKYGGETPICGGKNNKELSYDHKNKSMVASNDIESPKQKYNKDKKLVIFSLNEVKNYIIKNKKILYGGLAIDYALRLKGDKIYNDYEWPDFDFYSTNNVNNAYDIVNDFIDKGYNDISCIKAIHATTMRVRLQFMYIADISYCPKTVYDNLPTLKYNNIRIIHPDYQRMDMHISLGFPYYNPQYGMNIISRFEKDTDRLALLNKYYPIINDVKPKKNKKIKFKNKESEELIIHGMTALAFYLKKYSKDELKLKISSDGTITHNIISKEKVTYVWHTELFEKRINHNRYMDIIPERYENTKMKIYYYIDQLIVYNILYKYKIVPMHLVQLYLLSSYFTNKVRNKDYLYYYSLINKIDKKYPKDYVGIKNENIAFKKNLVRSMRTLGVPIPSELEKYTNPLPRNYFPVSKKTFDNVIESDIYGNITGERL